MRRTLPLLVLLAPTALAAQMADPSTRALGMGGAYSVLARGYEAAAWNPAVLAARHRPGFTFNLAHGALEFGSNAYGFGDFRTYSGKTLSDADKQFLLSKVDTSLDVRTLGGVSTLGFSVGAFSLSFGVSGDLEAGLGKDAVELALFGNASRTGPGQFFTAAGSHGRGWGASTLAASYARPFTLPLGRLSVGLTLKKIWGHGLGLGAETSSQLQVNPAFQAHAAGHAIYTHYPSGFSADGLNMFGSDGSPGSGYGADIGGLLELPGGMTVGLTIVNALGSMSWKADRFQYERADWLVQQSAGGGSVTDTLVRTTLVGAQIDGDPVAAALRDTLLAHSNFSRLVRAGASVRLAGIRFAADAQLRLSQGLDRQPSQAVAVGGEYIVLGFLPLRAGFATDFANTATFSAGSGLHFGPAQFDIGIANSTGGGQPGVRVGAGFGLIFGGGN
jgi:hypothetical protein